MLYFIIIYAMFLAPPSLPRNIRTVTQIGSTNSVNFLQWDPPTDNGGKDDLTYTVTISPPAQLSAPVVTSTSVTVSAADYNNEDYTISVVATNCAGNSTAEEYSFRVGELVDVVCGKSRSVCLQSIVYTVNEFTPTLVLWFVIHLPSLSSQEGVLSSLISLVMVPLDQSLAEYKVQQ